MKPAYYIREGDAFVIQLSLEHRQLFVSSNARPETIYNNDKDRIDKVVAIWKRHK